MKGCALRDDGERAPGAACPGSAADSMHIILGVGGQLIIHHNIHRWNVQSSAGHICRQHSDLDFASFLPVKQGISSQTSSDMDGKDAHQRASIRCPVR